MAHINYIAIYTNNLELEKEFYTRYFVAVSNEIYRDKETANDTVYGSLRRNFPVSK